ncbi:MAG: hypothetical protein EKK61_05415, partial [Rickettsiales bacterium]
MATCYQHFYNQLSPEIKTKAPEDDFLKYLNAQKIIPFLGQNISFNDYKTIRDDKIKESVKHITLKMKTTAKGRVEYNKIERNIKQKYQDLFKNIPPIINSKDFKNNFKIYTDNKDLSKAILSFIKGICLADNNEKFFEESAISFNKYLKNKKQSEEIENLSLNIIHCLMNLYASDESFKLSKELYNLYTKFKISFNDNQQNILAEIFRNAAFSFQCACQDSYMLYNAKIAYDICKQNYEVNKKIYFNAVHDFAKCVNEFNPKESLKYYDEAEKLQNNDLYVIEAKLVIYHNLLIYNYTHIQIGNDKFKIKDLIEAEFNKINDDQYKTLYNLPFDKAISNEDFLKKYEQIEKSNIEENFLKSSKQGLLLFSEAKYNILKNNLDQGLALYNQLFEVINTSDIIPYSYSMLRIFKKNNLYSDEKILNFYDNLTKNNSELKNHLSVPLKFSEFILYIEHGREKEAIKILEFLNSNAGFKADNNIFAESANEIYISTKFNEGKFQEALEYVKSRKIFNEEKATKYPILIIFDKDAAEKYQILIEKQIDL